MVYNIVLQVVKRINSETTLVQTTWRGKKRKAGCINKHAETHCLPRESVSNSHSIKVSLQEPVRLGTG